MYKILKSNLNKVKNLKELSLGTKKEPKWVNTIKAVLPQKNNKDGRTLAHYVAFYGKKKEVEFLLKLNADFNAEDNKKNPAWSYIFWYAKNPKDLLANFELLREYSYFIWNEKYKIYFTDKITTKNKIAKNEIKLLIEKHKNELSSAFSSLLEKIDDKKNYRLEIRAAYDEFKKELKQSVPSNKIIAFNKLLTKKITKLTNRKKILRKIKTKNANTCTKILNLGNNIKTLKQIQSVCKLLISLFLYENDLFSERIRKDIIKTWHENNKPYLRLEIKNIDNGIFLPIGTNDANGKNYLHYIIDHNKITALENLIKNQLQITDIQYALGLIKYAFAENRILMMCLLFGYTVPIGVDKKVLTCLQDDDKLKTYLAILINDQNLVETYVVNNRYKYKDKNLDIIFAFIKKHFDDSSAFAMNRLEKVIHTIRTIPTHKPFSKTRLKNAPPFKQKIGWFENFNKFNPMRINKLMLATKNCNNKHSIIPKIVFIVKKYLNELKYDVRFFGGLARDHALKIPTNDVDLVTNASCEVVTELVKYFCGYFRNGKHPHYQFTVWEDGIPIKVDINRIDRILSVDNALNYNSLDKYIDENHDFSCNSRQLKFNDPSTNLRNLEIKARTNNAIILDHSLIYRGIILYLKCQINSVTVSFEENTLNQINNIIPHLFKENVSLCPAKICYYLKKMLGNNNADEYLQLLFKHKFENILPFHVILNFKYKNLNNIYSNIRKINKLPYNTDKKLGKIFAELLWPYVKIHMYNKDIRKLINPVKKYMFYTSNNNEIYISAVNTLYFKRGKITPLHGHATGVIREEPGEG